MVSQMLACGVCAILGDKIGDLILIFILINTFYDYLKEK